VYINCIHGYGVDGIFTHTALYSPPPPNTRLAYDTVWFSFEGGKDIEVSVQPFNLKGGFMVFCLNLKVSVRMVKSKIYLLRFGSRFKK
jgi:hypothetical protein